MQYGELIQGSAERNGKPCRLAGRSPKEKSRSTLAHRGAISAMLLALCLLSSSAFSQAYPTSAVTVVVPWPPGGVADIAARVVTQHLGPRLGTSIVVENKTGANGIVGASAVARAAPDGHTLLLVTGEIYAFNPHVYAKLPYDPLADFVGITPVTKVLYVFAGKGSLRANSAMEALSLAKAQPGKLMYGSWGVGSLGQIGMEMVMQQRSLKMLHVPFNGGPPAYNALAADQIDLMILPLANAAPLAKGDKIKVFGITTPDRFSMFPDVRTMKEQGVDIDVANPVGFFAPAKTPVSVVRKLHAEINEVMKLPETRAALRAQGMEVFTLSQKEYADFLRTEYERWGKVIRRANIKISN